MLDTPFPQDRFGVCLKELLFWEGGWSNDPHDNGGPTMKGVTQRVYDGYRDSKGLGRRTVQLIEPGEYYELYRQNYWQAVRADELPAGLDLICFDTCVIGGPYRSIQLLQQTLGVTQDGHFGAATMAAAQRAMPVDLIPKYIENRRAFHRRSSKFWRFGKGWLNRCDGLERTALVMAGNTAARWEIAAPAPLADPDAQSATQGRATEAAPKPPAKIEALVGGTGLAGLGTGIGNAFMEIGKMTEPTTFKVAFAFLGQGLIWGSVILIVSTVFLHLWRKKFST